MTGLEERLLPGCWELETLGLIAPSQDLLEFLRVLQLLRKALLVENFLFHRFYLIRYRRQIKLLLRILHIKIY
jgi:hypothetical protein